MTWTFRDFPDNPRVLENLKDTFSKHKPIAFVGAGASAGLYPMWDPFIGQLADHTVAQGKAAPTDAERWKKDKDSTPQQRVDTIIRKLGVERYHTFLEKTFGPQRGCDGNCFTSVHAALLGLPFKGYLTTNYDPALDVARAKLRDTVSVGIPTWQDENVVYAWRTGGVFTPDACPVLWLHGCWQRPKGIVLNSKEYREAYRLGFFHDTFRNIWLTEHLVFVGFGFNDPQYNFMVGEFLRDLPYVEPRHVAILGWTMPEDGSTPDPEAITEKRAGLEADYHVHALFYPVWDGDHSELARLLDALQAECGCAATPPPTAPSSLSPSTPPAEPVTEALPAPASMAVPSSFSPTSPSPVAPSWPIKWVHETSDDAAFIGRTEAMDTLNRWVRDPAVRIVGVCAVGGAGKTALVGHWLKQTAGWRGLNRNFAGLFGWSFYQNQDSKEFLRELLEWAHEAFNWPQPGSDERRLRTEAVRLLREKPVVLVLDGLEVLQEERGETQEGVRHGTFLDADLRGLLHDLCEEADCTSLAVLTSRFTFADLDRHLGTAFHQLELPGLEDDQGAELLRRLSVGGPDRDRREVSRRLDGHPLALRVFNEALPEAERARSLQFLELVFTTGEVPEGSTLGGKLHRLLKFYEKRLPRDTVRLLSVVALFRTPVAEEMILHLARKLYGSKKKRPLPDDAARVRSLSGLHLRGILSREPLHGSQDGLGYACHPILRDHFRSVLLGSGLARRAADMLAGKPAAIRPRSVQEIEPILLAIEILLLAGQVRVANDLYQGRLERGELFKWLPALREGMICALGFVQNADRRKNLEEKLSRRALAFYLYEVAIFASHSGDYNTSLPFYHESYERQGSGEENVSDKSVNQRNMAALYVFQGKAVLAEQAASRALELAYQLREWQDLCDSFATYGWTLTLSGRLSEATEALARANALEKKYNSNGHELYSIRGIYWAELHLRGGLTSLTAKRTKANLGICQRHGWNHIIVSCHRVLAVTALAEGNLEDARAALEQAEAISQQGQILFELAQAHLTGGGLALARGDASAAQRRAAEALDLAGPRGMRMIQADALVLRGKARLLEARHEPSGLVQDANAAVQGAARAKHREDRATRALDDATEAKRMASQCGYPWGERDGLRLEIEALAILADIHAPTDPARAERERKAVATARREAEALDRKLTLTEADLAKADQEAQVWLTDWEKENAKQKRK